MTDKGQQAFDAAIQLYDPGINLLAKGLPIEDVKAAIRVVKVLRKYFEGEGAAEEQV